MANGFLVRTGNGISDVVFKASPVAGDRIFTSAKQWVTAQTGASYTALYRYGGGKMI